MFQWIKIYPIFYQNLKKKIDILEKWVVEILNIFFSFLFNLDVRECEKSTHTSIERKKIEYEENRWRR